MLRLGSGKRMGDALIGADRRILKNLTLFGIRGTHFQAVLGHTRAHGRRQDALRIERVEHHQRTHIDLTDNLVGRHFHVIEKHCVLPHALVKAHRFGCFSIPGASVGTTNRVRP